MIDAGSPRHLRMDQFDALEAPVRALVNEFGWDAVHALRVRGVTRPEAIRRLIMNAMGGTGAFGAGPRAERLRGGSAR